MDYFKRTRVAKILVEDSVATGQDLIILGWVRTIRESSNVAFIEINDGSCMNNLQAVINNPKDFPVLKDILTGAAIRAEGKLIESPAKGQKYDFVVEKLALVGPADQTYPLQKKRHSFEYLREIAHLRMRTNTLGAVNRVRSSIAYAVHKFFQDRGFYYIHTPVITASDTEGVGDMFRVTTFELNKAPVVDGGVNFNEDFFAAETYLTVSGQLEAEVAAQALGDVYTFGPTFRAENSNTARHASEFWMIEPEMAFCDLQGDMEIAVDFLKYLFRWALEKCASDMTFFNQWVDKGLIERLEHVVNSDFEKLPYTEAIKILEKSGEKFEFPVGWGVDMQSEHERYLTEKVFKKPVIVFDYPKKIKAFYMRVNDDGKTVGAMDVLVPKIGEIIGGSQREERYDVLLAHMQEKGMNTALYDWYLDLRKYGTTPHSGFGLGFDRTLMYITGMANIRDVSPFPRVPRWAKF
ncbi:MAG: asparagine--tRNA ligase [candidate division Zixibacteria bacterium HGW-Zixibacteria-1]|nr:MAG: asparagine--tRNA ligase [candidate division Zixibacteria bacterium HGW-Zixibacteria-1]